MWTGKGSILHLIQETREHSKAVTSFTVSESEDKLYSGSLDKTVRVGYILTVLLDLHSECISFSANYLFLCEGLEC